MRAECGSVPPSAWAATLRAKCFLTTSFLLNFSPTASAHYLACRGCESRVLFLDRPPKLQPAFRRTFPLGYHAVLLNGDPHHFLFAWVRHLATPRQADMTARTALPPHFQQDFSSGILAIKRGARDESTLVLTGPLFQRLTARRAGRSKRGSLAGSFNGQVRLHACSVKTYLAIL